MNSRLIQNQFILDKSFDPYSTADYHITILLREDGFSFVLTRENDHRLTGAGDFSLRSDVQANTPVMAERMLNEFGVYMMQHPWLSKPFGRAYILISNRLTTLIPSPLYETEQNDLYLKFNLPVPNGFITKADYLAEPGAYNVYALHEKWAQQLPLITPGAQVHHAASVFILAGFVFCRQHHLTDAVIIQPGVTWFEIAYFSANNLRFYNTFHYQTAEDFIYFVLFVLEQLNLNPELISVYLAGDIEEGSPLFTILHRYIRKVEFASRPANLPVTYEFESLPRHFYYTLIYRLLCEL